MDSKILDSYALMAFLQDEPSADVVEGILIAASEGKIHLAVCAVNLGEVWYSTRRAISPEAADRYVMQIQGMSIEVVDASWEISRQAAVYKSIGGISYADCFAAALAKLRNAELVTGDKEFKKVEKEIKISWL
ncbi:MAG: tRNA(fMet)-specific endonuclease VapC [Anaerolineales bacterium]|nr:tRNA(fMet)-specific endonuclease VapC [Anaerolineales bacterium]